MNARFPTRSLSSASVPSRSHRLTTAVDDGRRAVPDRLYEAGATNVWLVPSLSDVSSNTTGIAFRQKATAAWLPATSCTCLGPGTGQTQLERPAARPFGAGTSDDEELPELVRCTRTDQHIATDLTVDVDQERMPLLLGKPVVVQVRVAVLTIGAEVTTVDLGEVVRVELKQSADSGLSRSSAGINRTSMPTTCPKTTAGANASRVTERRLVGVRGGNYC